MSHKFFDLLNECMRKKGYNVFEDFDTEGSPLKKFPLARFISLMKVAHPFVFDSTSSAQALSDSGKALDTKSLLGLSDDEAADVLEAYRKEMSHRVFFVEELSLPFACSLYIMTKPGAIAIHDPKSTYSVKIHGYLVEEVGPRKVNIFSLSETTVGLGGRMFPILNYFEVDLSKTVKRNEDEILFVNRLTSMISVKRLGIEKDVKFTIRTKGVGAGFTVLRYPNLIHIADKVEYEYTTPISDSGIDFEWRGFWRGHWRAFYFPEATDTIGRRVVDWTRIGKNRSGDYGTPGHTWVVEHIKGDPALAEIKTHTVKKG